MSSLVGRESEIEQLGPLVLTTRLLTLTGSGGVGKTRLALELGRHLSREFAQGVWVVELASLDDPTLVPGAVSHALGLVEQPGRSVVDSLADYLESREILLILDNCEHLIAACAELLHTLLRRCCIDLRILATSREPIGVPGELTWRVPGLSIPPPPSGLPDPQILLEYEAVSLFVERAQMALPQFVLTKGNAGAIAQICRRLDGMPLALELAAARVRVLTVHQIVERLDKCFSLLNTNIRTAPARHQTLAATIDWSYALLSQQEKAVLRRLSVFADGFTVEAAEAVCADSAIPQGEILDLLSRLVDRSLVVSAAQDQEDETRYHLLETLRQYAAERLREGEEQESARDRHLEYYMALAERAEPEFRRANVVAWLDRLEVEHANLREAFGWALERAERSEEGALHAMRFAAAVEPFWRIRSHLSEGFTWLKKALAAPLGRGPSLERLGALAAAGKLAWLWSDLPTTLAYLDESRAMAQELGPAGRRGLANSLVISGRALWSYGRPAAARPLLEESLELFREIGDSLGIADALWHLGTVVPMLNPTVARDLYGRGLAIYEQHGDVWSAARVLQFMARLSYYVGDFIAAQHLYQESLARDRMLGFTPGIVATLYDLGRLWRIQGALEPAQTCYTEALMLSQQIGWIAGDETIHLGHLAAEKGDLKDATSLFQAGCASYVQDPSCFAACLTGLAGVAVKAGHPRRAARLLGIAQGIRERSGTELGWCDGPDHLREISKVHASLAPAVFDAEWAIGRADETEAALVYAMGAPAAEAHQPASRPTLLQAAKQQFDGLTVRERQVAALVAQGKPNREIAEALVISERTADAHISNILSKLDYTSRTQIVAWAIGKGLVAHQDD